MEQPALLLTDIETPNSRTPSTTSAVVIDSCLVGCPVRVPKVTVTCPSLVNRETINARVNGPETVRVEVMRCPDPTSAGWILETSVTCRSSQSR